MAAPETTKFQVNFKSPDGTLINLYATNKEELEALLTAAQDFSALIGSVSQSFGGAAPSAPIRTGQFSRPPAQINPLDDRANPPSGNTCRHGAMQYKEGVGAKGPWKGWMCASPKGTPISEKCPTIWVR